MRVFFPILLLCTSPAVANTFERPIPQSQSATAEIWFGLASLTLIVALALVHHLVMRK
jgi:hypothetical protein